MEQRPSRSSTSAAIESFEFKDRSYDPLSGEIRLAYRLGALDLEERFVLPVQKAVPPERLPALDAALDALHWIAGVSYWKSFCPPHWHFSKRWPDQTQATWLETIYCKGLAEFAWHNDLELEGLVRCPHRSPHRDPDAPASPASQPMPALGLGQGVLLPLGGGKDSLVAWHRLHEHLGPSSLMSVQVGGAPLIRSLGASMVAAGQVSTHFVIERFIDKKLFGLHQQGAMNGHVPITAINHAVLAVFALVIDAHWVVFANERSADEPTLIDAKGQEVNHQYSKSFAFEVLFNEWIKSYVAKDLDVFSILRRDRELSVVQAFSELKQFHHQFSSCNRNFHLDEKKRTSVMWCGRCPKCLFVYLTLALWLEPQALLEIFGADLFQDGDLVDDFRHLLALDGQKPFECVGEAAEARASVRALTKHPHHGSSEVIGRLGPELDGLEVPSIADLLVPQGPSIFPEEWMA